VGVPADWELLHLTSSARRHREQFLRLSCSFRWGASKERVRYDDPEGFSGSLVWNTRFVELGCDLSAWRPHEAVVTGLLRRWDTSTRTLLTWRVEHLLAWL
jgi:hypothetical protein